MPALQNRRWTLEEVRRLIDERPGRYPRYELVHGELLVTPSPSLRHQRIVVELMVLLRAYVDGFRLGEVSFSTDVHLDHESYLEPDILVIPAVDGQRQRADVPIRRLLLAVEVLSPSSVRHDRITKRRFYQEQGVPAYWIVDGGAEAVEVWQPGDERPAIVDDRLVWHPEGAAEPFVLDVREFFAAVADDPPGE